MQTDHSNDNLPQLEKANIEGEHIEQLDNDTAAGGPPTRMISGASTVAVPDLQVRAVIAVLACAIYWISTLFALTSLAAYGRNILAVIGDSSLSPWTIGCFNLVVIIVAPVLSNLSDIYGRKWLIVGSMLPGLAGSILGCRAKSSTSILVASALLGVTGSSLGMTTAIPSEVLPYRFRSFGQATVFTLSSSGAVLSLLAVSSAIKNDAVNGWRTFYYISIGLIGIQLPMWIFAYKPPKRDNELTRSHPSIDWIGYALLAAAATPLLIALTWAGGSYAWKSAGTLVPLCVGILFFVLLGLWEWKGRSDGFCHHQLWKDRNFTLSLFIIFVEGFVYLAYASTYPVMTATIYEHDIFLAGLRTASFNLAFFVALPIGGWYASRYRDTVSPIVVGQVLVTAAFIAFAVAKPKDGNLVLGMNIVGGLGFCQILTFVTVVAQFATPGSLIGTSTALVLSVRALGGALGSAISHTIYEPRFSRKLPEYVAKAVLPLGLNPQLLGPVIGAAASGDPAVIGQVLQIPGVTPQIFGAASAAVASAWSDSIRVVWIVMIPFAALGVIASCLIKRNKKQLDYTIDAPLEPVHMHPKHKEKHELQTV